MRDRSLYHESQLVQVYPDTTVDAARRSIAISRTGDLGELPFVVSERYGGFVVWLTTGSLRAPIRDRAEICHFAQVGQRVSLVICISSRYTASVVKRTTLSSILTTGRRQHGTAALRRFRVLSLGDRAVTRWR
jgi:hypothetical protein